jgi:hypothetical protein
LNYRSSVVDSNEGNFVDRSANFGGDGSQCLVGLFGVFWQKFERFASFGQVIVDQVLHQLLSRTTYLFLDLKKYLFY